MHINRGVDFLCSAAAGKVIDKNFWHALCRLAWAVVVGAMPPTDRSIDRTIYRPTGWPTVWPGTAFNATQYNKKNINVMSSKGGGTSFDWRAVVSNHCGPTQFLRTTTVTMMIEQSSGRINCLIKCTARWLIDGEMDVGVILKEFAQQQEVMLSWISNYRLNDIFWGGRL